MFFPIKRGTSQQLKILPDKVAIGFYRCEIEKTKDGLKFCRYNPLNTYTHIDLQIAKELNLKVELIQDNQPNAFTYTREQCVTGTQYFGATVDLLFKLKEKGNATAKKILTSLWGALCEKNMIKIINVIFK